MARHPCAVYAVPTISTFSGTRARQGNVFQKKQRRKLARPKQASLIHTREESTQAGVPAGSTAKKKSGASGTTSFGKNAVSRISASAIRTGGVVPQRRGVCSRERRLMSHGERPSMSETTTLVNPAISGGGIYTRTTFCRMAYIQPRGSTSITARRYACLVIAKLLGGYTMKTVRKSGAKENGHRNPNWS